MFLYLYSIFYTTAVYLAKAVAFFSSKVKVFLEQRMLWKSSLATSIHHTHKESVFWFHTASLGEFEQARPLIEKYRKKFPKSFIALTFFSASGYTVQKNYSAVNWVGYLPLDRKKDLELFLERLKPNALFLIKYEFWPQLIFCAKRKKIPIYSISSIFRSTQLFFKPWHFGTRKMLNAIDHFYVQNQVSVSLLKSIGIQKVTLTGDTRFDRVLDIADKEIDLSKIERFSQGKFCFVAGSTWPEDHATIVPILQQENIKIIIAPHKIDEETINDIQKQLVIPYARWSTLEAKDSDKNILILDCIGLLNKVYAYADAAYVGGGIGSSGLHNTLEPAVFGIPLIIGPNFKKYDEAVALVNNQGTFSIGNSTEFKNTLKMLLKSSVNSKEIGERNKRLIHASAGAVERIFSSLNQK